jgi:hypothetical protein
MKRDDGSLVGMSILPAGVAPEDSDEDEEERARAEEVLVAEDVSLNADNAGPCLFMLTKNVRIRFQCEHLIMAQTNF